MALIVEFFKFSHPFQTPQRPFRPTQKPHKSQRPFKPFQRLFRPPQSPSRTEKAFRLVGDFSDPFRGFSHLFRGFSDPFRGVSDPFRGLLDFLRDLSNSLRGLSEPLSLPVLLGILLDPFRGLSAFRPNQRPLRTYEK